MPEKNNLKHAAMQIFAGGSAGKTFSIIPLFFHEYNLRQHTTLEKWATRAIKKHIFSKINLKANWTMKFEKVTDTLTSQQFSPQSFNQAMALRYKENDFCIVIWLSTHIRYCSMCASGQHIPDVRRFISLIWINTNCSDKWHVVEKKLYREII